MLQYLTYFCRRIYKKKLLKKCHNFLENQYYLPVQTWIEPECFYIGDRNGKSIDFQESYAP